MNVQRNKVHHVTTIERVAKDFGVTEDLVHELTIGLDPEDGLIWVYGLDDEVIIDPAACHRFGRLGDDDGSMPS